MIQKNYNATYSGRRVSFTMVFFLSGYGSYAAIILQLIYSIFIKDDATGLFNWEQVSFVRTFELCQ